MTRSALVLFLTLAVSAAASPASAQQPNIAELNREAGLQSDSRLSATAVPTSTDRKALLSKPDAKTKKKSREVLGPDLVTPVVAPLGYVIKPVAASLTYLDTIMAPVGAVLQPIIGPIKQTSYEPTPAIAKK